MLESRTRGAGQTGRTTAHIMTWVSLMAHDRPAGTAGLRCEVRSGAVSHRMVGTLGNTKGLLSVHPTHTMPHLLASLPSIGSWTTTTSELNRRLYFPHINLALAAAVWGCDAIACVQLLLTRRAPALSLLLV